MIAPGDDRNIAGLQAADLFAGEYFAYLRTGQESSVYMALSTAPIAEFSISPLLSLHHSRRHGESCWEREIAAEMPPGWVMLGGLPGRGV